MFDPFYNSVFTPEDILAQVEMLKQTDPQGAKLREGLYSYRFYSQKIGKETVVCDRFLAFWMNLLYHSKTITKSKFRLAHARRELEKALNNKELSKVFSEQWPNHRVLYEQLYNAARRFLASCRTDKTYSSFMFGFVSLKLPQLTEKMVADYFDAFVCFPWRCSLLDSFPVICFAAFDAWQDDIPNTEDMIWRRISKTAGTEASEMIRQLLNSYCEQ